MCVHSQWLWGPLIKPCTKFHSFVWGLTLKGKTQRATITLDVNLNCNTQPPTRHTHTLVSFLQSENTLPCGCHSNPIANKSPKPFLAEGMKIAPIKFALQSIGFHCCRHVKPRTCTHFPRHPAYIVFPHSPPNSGEGSIINQFTNCERHLAVDGNEQWQIKDIGKHFLAVAVSGYRRWHHLVCSWHTKPNSVFACAFTCGWWIRDSRDEEKGRGSVYRESVACVGSWIINSGNIQS